MGFFNSEICWVISSVVKQRLIFLDNGEDLNSRFVQSDDPMTAVCLDFGHVRKIQNAC